MTEYDKSPRAIAMLLRIKNAALTGIDNTEWVELFGCGTHAVARYIDALIDDYNRTKTNFASADRMKNIYQAECKEWRAVGFDCMPSEYSQERRDELKALAEKWRREDAGEADPVHTRHFLSEHRAGDPVQSDLPGRKHEEAPHGGLPLLDGQADGRAVEGGEVG